VILVTIGLLVSLTGLRPPGATALPQPGPTPHAALATPTDAQAPVLQFRSQGHVLGFTPERMYTVGMGGALIEEFVGAHPVQPQAANAPSPAPTTSRTGAPPFQSVTYPHLWDGITLSYTTSPAGLAMSTYRIDPQADPTRIRLRYNTDIALQPDGSLRVPHSTANGYFTLSAPHAWQEVDGRRVPVSVAFTHPAPQVVGFTVGPYDPTHPLLIDPTYSWHTFYGSASDDIGYGIAVDGSGNVYVTGESYATWNGPSGETPLHPHSGGWDLVVLKLTSAGAYQWHTFYGSTADDYGYGIAVDGSGSVYVTGYSEATWNGPSGQAPLHPHSGSRDIVVLKLTSAGTYQWHTFYGSARNDFGLAIAVDGSGNVYVTGYSSATWGTPLHPYSGDADIVVLKLTSAGAYQWHTFCGSVTSGDAGYGIAVDGSGNVYVTGRSMATWGVPLHPHSGSWDLVVLKLSNAGAYQWHTFYGSTFDRGSAIAVDGSGNVYVTGYSEATWNGPSGETPLHQYSGYDLVVLKLSNAGAYQWHTFYGSANDDVGSDIAVDGSGNVYVTGSSDATWGAPLHPQSGDADIVVLKLSGDAPLATLVASILPGSRSVQVGTPATAFATIINAGPGLATGCSLAPITPLPATFTAQTTDPGNLPTGAPNTPIDIPVGVAQSFVFALTPTAPFAPTDVQFSFACANSAPASVIGGVNTLLLVASASPVPDIIALGDTPSHDGILHLASIGAFGVATVNVGIGAVITVTPDTGSASLPLTLSICQTNPATAACLAPPAPSVTTQIDANATPTFSIFADAGSPIPLDAATNRIFVRFTDGGGVTRGATSVAVCTQPGCP
jgi:hypothetical protein